MADTTGTKDTTYNLVSVLYHALQGADLYEQYASDAGSDQDLAAFFREAQQQEKQRADRAKQLLAKRLQQSS
jgi:maltooligosyltrehalose synthase